MEGKDTQVTPLYSMLIKTTIPKRYLIKWKKYQHKLLIALNY